MTYPRRTTRGTKLAIIRLCRTHLPERPVTPGPGYGSHRMLWSEASTRHPTTVPWYANPADVRACTPRTCTRAQLR